MTSRNQRLGSFNAAMLRVQERLSFVSLQETRDKMRHRLSISYCARSAKINIPVPPIPTKAKTPVVTIRQAIAAENQLKQVKDNPRPVQTQLCAEDVHQPRR